MRMQLSDQQARKVCQITGVVLLTALLTDPAYADIEGGLNTIKGWLTTVSTPVGIIAVMGVGFAKLTGRLDWGKAVAVLIGLGIIFSAVTIVGWMSGG